MSEHHVWDTPLLFVAALAGLIGVGIGAGHALGFLDGEFLAYLPAVSWAMAGVCLVLTIGHARGVDQFEMPHIRLVFLASASLFIHVFLGIVAAILLLLLLWGLLQALIDGDLF